MDEEFKEEFLLGFDTPEEVEMRKEKQKKMSGEVFVKLKSEYKPPYLNPEKTKEVMEEMSTSIVHDYGGRDSWNLTEEQREEKFMFYKYFKELNMKAIKFKTRKLSEYIKMMRKCIKCLKLVADNNGDDNLSSDEFLKLYRKGKIYIPGLRFPKFTNKKIKRLIDEEFLMDYILSDKDPVDIEYEIGAKFEAMDMTDVASPSVVNDLISKEELEKLSSVEGFKEEMNSLVKNSVSANKLSEIDDGVIIDEGNTSIKGLREIPGLIDLIVNLDIAKRENRKKNSYLYEANFDESDYEKIAKYNMRYNGKKGSPTDIPLFEGDLMNGKDYYQYMKEVNEFQLTHVKVPSGEYRSEKVSLEERQDSDFRDLLQELGYDVRNMYDNGEKERSNKKELKKTKKVIAQYKKKLLIEDKIKKGNMSTSEIKRARLKLQKGMNTSKKKKKKKGAKF